MGLTEVTIPDSVTSIGQSAFGSNSLVSVVIPNSVTFMSSAVFQFNSTLTSVTLSTSMTSIPDYTFWQTSLTSISIPDSVTSIGDSAFLWNYSLTSLTLGNSVQSIGDSAFESAGITTVILPSSLDSIGNNAFNSASLTSAVFQSGAPTTFTARSVGNGSFGDQNVTVYYPSAHVANFTPSPWQGYVTAQGATLSFDLSGHGSAIANVTVIPGTNLPASAAPPADPTASGYTFQGWFTAATNGTAFNFAAQLAGDVTAHARWTANPALAATGVEMLPLLTVGGSLLLLGAVAVALGIWMRRKTTNAPPKA